MRCVSNRTRHLGTWRRVPSKWWVVRKFNSTPLQSSTYYFSRLSQVCKTSLQRLVLTKQTILVSKGPLQVSNRQTIRRRNSFTIIINIASTIHTRNRRDNSLACYRLIDRRRRTPPNKVATTSSSNWLASSKFCWWKKCNRRNRCKLSKAHSSSKCNSSKWVNSSTLRSKRCCSKCSSSNSSRLETLRRRCRQRWLCNHKPLWITHNSNPHFKCSRSRFTIYTHHSKPIIKTAISDSMSVISS